MAKALVVYATRTGETKGVAELIAEGIFFQKEKWIFQMNSIDPIIALDMAKR
jgi:flavodoxin